VARVDDADPQTSGQPIVTYGKRYRGSTAIRQSQSICPGVIRDSTPPKAFRRCRGVDSVPPPVGCQDQRPVDLRRFFFAQHEC